MFTFQLVFFPSIRQNTFINFIPKDTIKVLTIFDFTWKSSLNILERHIASSIHQKDFPDNICILRINFKRILNALFTSIT